jgi:hypothetical protein
MREFYDKGWSMTKLAKHFDRSVPTIRKYLKETGAEIRSRPGRPNGPAEPKQQLDLPEPEIPDPPKIVVRPSAPNNTGRRIWKYDG